MNRAGRNAAVFQSIFLRLQPLMAALLCLPGVHIACKLSPTDSSTDCVPRTCPSSNSLWLPVCTQCCQLPAIRLCSDILSPSQMASRYAIPGKRLISRRSARRSLQAPDYVINATAPGGNWTFSPTSHEDDFPFEVSVAKAESVQSSWRLAGRAASVHVSILRTVDQRSLD